jgi:hypothetical protein
MTAQPNKCSAQAAVTGFVFSSELSWKVSSQKPCDIFHHDLWHLVMLFIGQEIAGNS